MNYKTLITIIMLASVSLHATQKTTGRILDAISQLKKALLQEELARIPVRLQMASLATLRTKLQSLETESDKDHEISYRKFDIHCCKQDLREALPKLLLASKETKAILQKYHDVLPIVYNETERNAEYVAALKELK